MPTSSGALRTKKETSTFKVPQADRAPSANSAFGRTIRKSSSFQNLKALSTTKSTLGNVSTSTEKSKRSIALNQKHHGSTASLQTVCTDKSASTKSDTPFQSQTLNGNKAKSNAHRISVNSDLLSRVEKEKKQYEARISELTQVTESRKMEIEKLTFEVRRLRKEASDACSSLEELKKENANLIAQLGIKEGEGIDSQAKALPSTLRKTTGTTNSPPDSVGTTTRMTPGGGGRTTSSLSGDWIEPTVSLDLSTFDCRTNCSIDLPTERAELDRQFSQPSISVATLQGRLLQMEEANYTTNEELQATLQELWDLQRSVDEAHEETHNLAFERGILLEALSTQTSKLEHCRFQIEQLKHLLLTDPRAQAAGSRENHFCELYASIEQEKQVLLSQNNDLAQSSDSLAKECRILTEKASQLQDSFDSLQAEHAALKSAYQNLSMELGLPKSPGEGDQTDACASAVRVAGDGASRSTDGCRNCGSDLVSRLQLELVEVKRERNELREQCDLLRAEREHETTEWRLYERDLLKTVQVADCIKTESEAEVQRLLKENELLKSKIEKANHEADALSSELTLTKEKLANLSKRDLQNNFVGQEIIISEDKVRQVESALMAQTPAKEERPSENNNSPAASTLGDADRFSTTCAHHRPNNFGLNNHLRPYTASPRTPLRPSCMTNGPTVRSLIQSIENQVKAVQHQKRGFSSKAQCTVSPTPGTNPALRLFKGSNSSDRPGLPNGVLISSPAKPSTLRSNHLQPSTPANSSFTKENTSAPGGPSTCAPLPLTSDNTRRTNGVNDIINRTEKHSENVFLNTRNHSQDQPGLGVTDNSKCKEDTFSPCRRTMSLHVSDRCMSNSTSATLSSTSKHQSFERAVSPTSRRYSSDLKSTHASESPVAEPVQPQLEATSTETFSGVHHIWSDPLQDLARRTQAGSKRNALLLWCKSRVAGYRGVEVTNFSSAWNNGLALCALLHTYIPSKIPWDDLVTPNGLPVDKRRCFEVAFKAAESVGIPTTLKLHDMITTERPDWNAVMSYVTSIYLRYEVPTVSGRSGSSPAVVT